MSDLVEWLRACIADDEQQACSDQERREAVRNCRVFERHGPASDDGTKCQWCFVGVVDRLSFPCTELRDLASVYTDREGYRPEWGPVGE